jgi:hypothetical protein
VILFGLWTIACNTTVILEGPLSQAILTFVAFVALIWYWQVRSIRMSGEADSEVEPSPSKSHNSPGKPRDTIAESLSSRQALVFVLLMLFGVVATLSFKKQYYLTGWLLSLVCFLLALIPGGSPQASDDVACEPSAPPKPVWYLAIFAVGMALFAHRPDWDDSAYVNMAVAIADNPGAPLLKNETMMGLQDAPIYFAVRKVHSLEIMAGAISLIAHVPAIFAMHIIIPAVAAFLTVLAYSQLFQIVCPRRVVWCVLGTLLFLCTNGEAHASFGNFSFVRLHQGKGILVSILIPLIVGYSISFALRPNARTWLLLALSQAAAVGLTPTAVWVVPVIAFLGLLACFDLLGGRVVKVFPAGVLSSIYPLIVGIYMKLTIKMPASVFSNKLTWEQLFHYLGAYALGRTGFVLLILLCLLATWYFAYEHLARRICLVFPIGFLLVFMNPFTIIHVADNITSAQVHWRSLWILPLPMMVGVFLAAPLGSRTTFHRINRHQLVYVVLLVMFAAGQRHIFSSVNRTHISWPALKVDGYYRVSRRFSELIDDRSIVVAPPRVASWLTTIHNHPYPLFVNSSYWDRYSIILGKEEASERATVQRYVEGSYHPSTGARYLLTTLPKYDVRGICMPLTNPWKSEIGAALKSMGFYRKEVVLGYELWLRTP